MLYDRGYQVAKQLLDQTYEQFTEEFGEGVTRAGLDNEYVHCTDDTKKVQLLFSCELSFLGIFVDNFC